jgi:hypothetical protein
MHRRSAAVLLLLAATAHGDVFDHYVNPTLAKLAGSKDAAEVKRLTSAMVLAHDRVLPGTPSAFLIVRTNGDRYAKLLLQTGRQRLPGGKTVPILSIEQFVTYKEGEERAVVASGKNQSLYDGFRFSLDLGQVVPEAVGGDVRFVVEGDKAYAEPVGKAKLYLVTRHDPALEPKTPGKLVMGRKFEARYFAGTFRLHDDGRRSGKLILSVDDDKRVTGSYYSDKDGAKYEVNGKIALAPPHAIEFTIKFPRVEQTFKGMLFTGDGKAMAGTSRLAEREAAFYATREE